MAKKIIVALFAVLLFCFSVFAHGEEAGERPENLFEVTLKEVRFNITPSFKFVLPDTFARMLIRQHIGKTVLEADTFYNYIYSEMKYKLRYILEFEYPVALSLYDEINFEKKYEDNSYLQRNKGIGFTFQTPEYFGFLTLRQQIKYENIYFSQLETVMTAEDNNNFMLTTFAGFHFRDEKGRTDLYTDISLEKAIPHDLSPINFLFMNCSFLKVFRMGRTRQFSLRAELGYEFEGHVVPIWKKYLMGGYDRMMGYNYDTLQGNNKFFTRWKLDFLLGENTGWELPMLQFANVNSFIVTDIGVVGGKEDFIDASKYNISFGLGLIFHAVFRGKTKMKITVAIAQPIEEGMWPMFYFVHEI